MGYALLQNSTAGSEIKIINSLIEQYKAENETINANTFIDFINKSIIDSSTLKNLYNATHAGILNSCYSDQTMNSDWTNATIDYYYLTYGMKTFKNCTFKLDDNTVLMFLNNREAQDGYYNHAILLTLENNNVTLNASVQLAGLGSNLQAIKLTDTRFLIASGSFRTCTNSSFVLHFSTLDVDLPNKTFAIKHAISTGRWRYISLAGLFKISENNAVAFFADGNGGNGYYYHTAYAMTIDADGIITLGNFNLQGIYSHLTGQVYYQVHQIAANKFVEVCHYNYPIITIVTVNGNQNSRSGYIALSAITAYGDRNHIYHSFSLGNYVFVPYFNGNTWNVCSVDCSGDVPVEQSHVSLATNGDVWPIIKQVSDNKILALQRNGNTAYGTLITYYNNGNMVSSNCVLTVGVKISEIRKFVQTGNDQGYLICSSFSQTYGLVAIPMTFKQEALRSGAPQIWNESYAFDFNYTFFMSLGNGESICIYQPYNYSYYNSLACFAVAQRGLELKRGNNIDIFKNDQYPTNTQRMVSDIYINSNDEIILLFRSFINGNTSYYDLYITNILVKNGRAYIGPVKKIASDTQTAQRNFNYARLVKFTDNAFLALCNYNDSNLSGIPINITQDFRIIPSDRTGIISGVTKTQATQALEGKVLMLGA